MARAPFKKAIGSDLLSLEGRHVDRFRHARAAGFEAVELKSSADAVAELAEASKVSGLKVHSVQCPWHSLTSADPGSTRATIAAVHQALSCARRWGADTVLLTGAFVDRDTSHAEAYARSQALIRRELEPAAKEAGVVLGIENVWHGFLVSPVEYARYIDELESPWVRAYLDVANVIFGHEHWVRTLGARIIKVHIKDFSLDLASGRFAFGKVGEGSIDWLALRSALMDVGFTGYATSTGIFRDSLAGWLHRRAQSWRHRVGTRAPGASVRRHADAAFLADVGRRFDRFADGD